MELQPINQEFNVSYRYSCYFTEGLFNTENSLLSSIIAPSENGFQKKVLVVLDSGVAETHPKLQNDITSYADVHKFNLAGIMVIPGGEECKNDTTYLQSLLKAIDDHHICRHSFVVAIGGGAVLDLVGYAAAIAHRGVRLIRVPTTVLAQNDAGVGVKNGINRFGKKNFTGTFALPVAIINDSNFLNTLEERDWIAGSAEAVKVALLKDADFFDFLETNAEKIAKRDLSLMSRLIHRCAELHMAHIGGEGDPFENGSSRPLDFGHWAAHKLEQLSNYQIRHGEAVAIGLAIDCTYAHLMGFLDSKTLQRILDTLKSLGFKLQTDKGYPAEDLLSGIEEFREHLGGRLTLTTINGIGDKRDIHTVDTAVMKKAIAPWFS